MPTISLFSVTTGRSSTIIWQCSGSSWFLVPVLAGRFEECLAADFEFEELRPEFGAARPELQARIREAIVRSGDLRMAGPLVEPREDRPLSDLSDHDADPLVQLYARNKDWDALFRPLWFLPARRIADAVTAIQQAGWEPQDEDRRLLFRELLSWVKAHSQQATPCCPQSWPTRSSESGWPAGKQSGGTICWGPSIL